MKHDCSLTFAQLPARRPGGSETMADNLRNSSTRTCARPF